MPRSSFWAVFGDGEDAYGDRYDTGEFTTYGQSYGPSSNAYSNGMSHDGNTSSRRSRRAARGEGDYPNAGRSRQVAWDEDGYAIEDSYAGEEDLRRRMLRYTMGESTSRTDPRTRLGRDDRYSYEPGRRTLLAQQTSTSARDSREARIRQREREQAELECQLQLQQEQEQRRRRADRDAFGSRPRRGAVTAEHDDFVAYLRHERERLMREDETPENVRRYGRGYFPAYEYR